MALERQIRQVVQEQTGLPFDLAPAADLTALGVWGDDLWSLLEEYAARFGVRMDTFRWHHHGGPDGCNPLWLVFRPLWLTEHVPIRLADLIESARSGVWSVRYPGPVTSSPHSAARSTRRSGPA